jgi:hypothetical protein
MDPDNAHFSWVGAAFWAVVLAWLVRCAWVTWRGIRARAVAGP